VPGSPRPRARFWPHPSCYRAPLLPWAWPRCPAALHRLAEVIPSCMAPFLWSWCAMLCLRRSCLSFRLPLPCSVGRARTPVFHSLWPPFGVWLVWAYGPCSTFWAPCWVPWPWLPWPPFRPCSVGSAWGASPSGEDSVSPNRELRPATIAIKYLWGPLALRTRLLRFGMLSASSRRQVALILCPAPPLVDSWSALTSFLRSCPLDRTGGHRWHPAYRRHGPTVSPAPPSPAWSAFSLRP